MVAKQADSMHPAQSQSGGPFAQSQGNGAHGTQGAQGAHAQAAPGTLGSAGAHAAAAVVDVIKAAQRMIVARIDLAQLQLKDTAQSVALLTGAAAVGAFGWVVLMGAVVSLLTGPLPLSAALAIVGGVHVIVAFALVVFARRKARPPRSTLSPEPEHEHKKSEKRETRVSHLRGVP